MYFIKVIFLFAILIGLFACCKSSNDQNPSNKTTPNSANQTSDIKVEIPQGDEITVDIRRVNQNTSLVTVKNVSDRDIFCPCSPETNDDKTRDFATNVEFRKNPNGEFELYSGNSDYSPGVNAIHPQKSADFEIYHSKRGEYRVKFGYLIDSKVRNLVTEKIPEPGLTKEESEAVYKAWRDVVTPILKRP